MRDYQPIDPPEKGASRSPTRARPRRRASQSEAGGPCSRVAPRVLTRIPSLATADPLNRPETAPSDGHRGLSRSSIFTRILAGGVAVLLGAAVITAVYQFSRGKEDRKDQPTQSAQVSSPPAAVSPASAAGGPLWDKARNEAPPWQPAARPEEPSDLIGQVFGPASPNPPAMSTTYHESLEAGRAPARGFGANRPSTTANRPMAIADGVTPGTASPRQGYASSAGYGTSRPSTPDQASLWLDYQDYAALAALQGPTLATETARAAAAARLQAAPPPGSGDPSAVYPPRYPSTGYPPAEVVSRGSAAPGPKADGSVPAADPDVARFEGTIQKPPVQTTYERTRSSLH